MGIEQSGQSKHITHSRWKRDGKAVPEGLKKTLQAVLDSNDTETK